jgi:hypothetical protein
VYGDDNDGAFQYAHLWMTYDGGDYEVDVAGASRVFHVDQRPFCHAMNRGFCIITCGKYPGMAVSRFPPEEFKLGRFNFVMGLGYVSIESKAGQITVSKSKFDTACSVLRDSNLNSPEDVGFRTDFRKNIKFELKYLDDRGLEILYNACVVYRSHNRMAGSEDMFETCGVHSASTLIVERSDQSKWLVWSNGFKRAVVKPFTIGGGDLPPLVVGAIWAVIYAVLIASAVAWYRWHYCFDFGWGEVPNAMLATLFPAYVDRIAVDTGSRFIRHLFGSTQRCLLPWPIGCFGAAYLRAVPKGLLFCLFVLVVFEEIMVQCVFMQWFTRVQAVSIWCLIEVVLNLIVLIRLFEKSSQNLPRELEHLGLAVQRATMYPFLAHIGVELVSYTLPMPGPYARVTAHLLWNYACVFAPWPEAAGWCAMLRLDEFFVVTAEGSALKDFIPELVRGCAARVEGPCAEAQSVMGFEACFAEFPRIDGRSSEDSYKDVCKLALEMASALGFDFVDKSYYAIAIRYRMTAHPTRTRSWLMYCVENAPIPLRLQSCNHNIVQSFNRRYASAVREPPSPTTVALLMSTPAYRSLLKSCDLARQTGELLDSDESVAAYREKLKREGKLELMDSRREGRRASRTRTASPKTNESVLIGNVKPCKSRLIVAGSDRECLAINQLFYAATKLLQKYDAEPYKSRDQPATFTRFTGNSHELADKWLARALSAGSARVPTSNEMVAIGWFILNFDIEACDGSWSLCVLAMALLPFVYIGVVPLMAVEKLWIAGALLHAAYLQSIGEPVEFESLQFPWTQFEVVPSSDMYSQVEDYYVMTDIIVEAFTGKVRDRRRTVEMWISGKMGSGTAGTSILTTIMACAMIKHAVQLYLSCLASEHAQVVNAVDHLTPVLGNGDDTNHVVIAALGGRTLEGEMALLKACVVQAASDLGFKVTGEVEYVEDLSVLTGDMCSKLAMPAIVNGFDTILMSRKIGRAIVMLGAADAAIGERKVVEHFFGRIRDVERDHQHDVITLSLARGLLRSDCFMEISAVAPRGSEAERLLIEGSRSDDHEYSAHVDEDAIIGRSVQYFAFVEARYNLSAEDVVDLCAYLEEARVGLVLAHYALSQITAIDC